MFMQDIDKFRDEIDQILDKLHNDYSLVSSLPPGPRGDKRVCVENLEVWAGDHLFDMKNEWFDIGKNRGKNIRAYLQGIPNNYEFVPELYKEFPDKLEGEKEEYLEEINEYREREGLETFSMDEDGRIYRELKK